MLPRVRTFLRGERLADTFSLGEELRGNQGAIEQGRLGFGQQTRVVIVNQKKNIGFSAKCKFMVNNE